MTTTRTYLDFHILQSVPPSCINRDDTGSPKSALYGGVRRARVSSQSWKRATRRRFAEELDQSDLGVRTKRVVELVGERLSGLADLDPDSVKELAVAAVGATGLKLTKARKSDRLETEFLVLVSSQQADALAGLAASALEQVEGDLNAAVKTLGSTESKREAKRVLGQGNSVDLALFGRMVANDTDLNVDATCQVAHALSVHAADSEFDYFTAVDDLKGVGDDPDSDRDSGAGMIGTVEFASATLYRYASINVDGLAASLGDRPMTQRGIEAFARAFVLSMPTGKVNTFANHTLPELVLVSLREDQPVSLVGAFEKAVQAADGGGYTTRAADALADWQHRTAEAYGVSPVTSWLVNVGPVTSQVEALGERVAFTDLPAAVAAAAVARLAEQP